MDEFLYTKLANRKRPKLVVYVVDESGTMSDSYAGRQKSDWVADELNKQVQQLFDRCQRRGADKKPMIKSLVHLAVLGYGGGDPNWPVRSLLPEHPDDRWRLPLHDIYKWALNDHPPRQDGPWRFMQVQHSGPTPTAHAIHQAGLVVQEWLELSSKRENCKPVDLPLPAPTIIHITDGQPTDDHSEHGPVEDRVNNLPLLATEDGETLLINIGIPSGDRPLPLCCLPTEAELPNNPYMQRLWHLSSPLPEQLWRRAVDYDLLPEGSTAAGRRLFIQVGPNSNLANIFEFGSFGTPGR